VQETKKSFFPRWAAILAVAVGVGAGSYGIATAASGNSAGSATAAATTTTPAAPAATAQRQPWGHERSDETRLTGDNLSKVTAAAQAKVPGGTIVRVETDADGNAAYEAHMTNASGNEVTVYVDKSFNVVSVETR
jgi:hypothetical protein